MARERPRLGFSWAPAGLCFWGEKSVLLDKTNLVQDFYLNFFISHPVMKSAKTYSLKPINYRRSIINLIFVFDAARRYAKVGHLNY
jgi:hypothetical protein